MGEPHVVSALNDKRARLLGEIDATRERLDVLLQQLAHIDGALALFDHKHGKPVKPIRSRPQGYFQRGELVRLVFTLLRERGPHRPWRSGMRWSSGRPSGWIREPLSTFTARS